MYKLVMLTVNLLAIQNHKSVHVNGIKYKKRKTIFFCLSRTIIKSLLSRSTGLWYESEIEIETLSRLNRIIGRIRNDFDGFALLLKFTVASYLVYVR